MNWLFGECNICGCMMKIDDEKEDNICERCQEEKDDWDYQCAMENALWESNPW
ncbi:MAG: hypothetical protein ACRCVJ_11875 [Clostridium sp.]|uniref:hypothetical protein n=1 Tax=Clostridium sp. TaxID=1506 RepID=UPI003F320576